VSGRLSLVNGHLFVVSGQSWNEWFTKSLANSPMDGKAKKKLEVIKQKLQLLRQKLSGAKRQNDEPGEVRNLEQEIARLEAEAAKLKG
jgi:hypothetical protein